MTTNDLAASAHARILSTPVGMQYAGEDTDNDLSIYTDAKETDVTTTRYEIKTGPKHHYGTRPWMALASTVTVDCKSVGAWCHYEAATTDPAALEAALEADDDVVEYSATATKTPEEIGADDLNSWIADQTINNPTADTAELATEILATRGNGHKEPDEALINAMGTGWILEQCGAEDTEENWASKGLPWCERYNAGYWAAAQALTEAT